LLSHHCGRPEFGGNGLGLSSTTPCGPEYGVDVACRSAGVVGQGHRRAAEDMKVGDDPAPGQPAAEASEGVLDSGSVEQRIAGAHATSSSWEATYTPSRRNAAGA
jgi:hypothetical protein